MNYDIFNGDADGIFALHQLRLQTPANDSKLITGVKRDIQLLQKVKTSEKSNFTVLDISLDSNRESLNRILQDTSNSVTYIDHHFAGEVPQTQNLTAHIETSAETCTSLIVNQLLKGKHVDWAICGAFGDNLHKAARELCQQKKYSEEQIQQLSEIGELFNYNGYGTTLEDLHFHPADLFRAVQGYENAFDFHKESEHLNTLRTGYSEDLDKALTIKEHHSIDKNRVYFFPDEAWARRVVGVFSNLKAREKRNSAHAIVTENSDKTVRISVRAPLDDRRDAAKLCNEFPTGGGREAAAGVNSLPADLLDSFLKRFSEIYR